MDCAGLLCGNKVGKEKKKGKAYLSSLLTRQPSPRRRGHNGCRCRRSPVRLGNNRGLGIVDCRGVKEGRCIRGRGAAARRGRSDGGG
jgi:hypothetical protein